MEVVCDHALECFDYGCHHKRTHLTRHVDIAYGYQRSNSGVPGSMPCTETGKCNMLKNSGGCVHSDCASVRCIPVEDFVAAHRDKLETNSMDWILREI